MSERHYPAVSRSRLADCLIAAWTGTDLGDAVDELVSDELNIAYARVVSILVGIRDEVQS